MDQIALPVLDTPHIRAADARLIGGISKNYSAQTAVAIPEQWQRFRPYIGQIAGQVGTDAYGVAYDTDGQGSMNYMSGVEVTEGALLPEGFSTVELPAHQYAVFKHTDHISTIRLTFFAIFSNWLPTSNFQIANAPCVERYTDTFDSSTGLGGLEIWIPVVAK